MTSGAGIAGPTLAYWLVHSGWQPTMVEAAAGLRTGGYVIDFRGAGFEIAERMGRLDEICRKGYVVEEVRVVNASGRRLAGFPRARFLARSSSWGSSLGFSFIPVLRPVDPVNHHETVDS